MALIDELEKQGNFLFKYRGQFPVFLFILVVPFMYYTNSVNPKLAENYTIIAIFLSFLGFLIRCYTIGTTPRGTSGRNTKQQIAEELNSTGIYSIVRHPLYLGNYFMWIGIVVYTYNLYFILFVSLLYWLYYERIMFAEERFLERKFGQIFLKWSSQLPAFVPNFSRFKKSHISFSLISVLRREYSGVLATVIGFSYVSVLRHYFEYKRWEIDQKHIVVLLTAAVLSIILRTLKRHTKVLEET